MTWSSAYAPLRSSAPPPRRLGETQVRSRGHCLHLRLRRPGGARPVQGGKAVPAAVRPLRTQARAPTLPGGHFLPRLLATARRVVDIPGRGAAGLSPESRSPRDGKFGVFVLLQGRLSARPSLPAPEIDPGLASAGAAAKAGGSRSFLEEREGDPEGMRGRREDV